MIISFHHFKFIGELYNYIVFRLHEHMQNSLYWIVITVGICATVFAGHIAATLDPIQYSLYSEVRHLRLAESPHSGVDVDN